MAGGNVIINIVGNSSQLSAALGKASGDLDGFAGKMQSVGSKMSSIGKGLTLGLTVPIVGVGALAFKAAQDFESAFAGVTKTVEGTDAQLQTIRDGIIAMSKELPASTTEIAAIAEAAGALGIQTDHVLDFTRVMIDLGETTNLTADQAADAFARIANIMQIPQDQFDEMGSTVVDLGNKTASTESEITEMALRIAGAGRAVGLSADQVLSISAALASVGLDAEAGGSAISRTFIDIANAASSGGDQLAGFASVAGQSADQFAEKFRTDAAGAFTDFITGLQNIHASGGDVLGTLDGLGITEIRQRDAILRLVGAGGLLNDTLGIGNKAWGDNNALTDEAQKRYKTNAAKMEILKNRLTDVLRVLGESLMPIIEQFAGWLTKLAEKWKTLSPETQKFILIAGALAAVLGPLLITLGALATAIGAILSPVGLVIIAIIAVVAAVYFLWTNWDKVWGWIKEHPAIAAIIAILAAPIAAFVLIVGALKWLYENWDTIWSAIKQIAQIAWDSVLSPVFNVIVEAVGIVGWVIGILRGVWDGAWAAIKSIIQTAWDTVLSPVFEAIAGAIGAIVWALGVLKGVWDAIWNGLGATLAVALAPILGPIYAVIGALQQIISFATEAKRRIEGLFNSGGGSVIPGMPSLPLIGQFASGGPIPGPTGAPALAVVHGGEFVVPANGALISTPSTTAASTTTIHVTVNGSVLTEDDLVSAIHKGLLRKQRTSGSLGLN
jgi:TP901 family phage tail tape measure protein